MSATENVQSYLPLISAGNVLPKTTNVAFTLNRNYQAILPISSSDIERFLITAGEYYAVQLIRVLDALKNLNEDAIYPITSIIGPYIDTTELYLLMPPTSSTSITTNALNKETAEPTDAGVQGESFFRFLDELESGVYAADDIATGE